MPPRTPVSLAPVSAARKDPMYDFTPRPLIERGGGPVPRRRFLALAGSALVLPALLAACGNDDAPTTPAPVSTGVGATSVPQGSGEKIKIGFIALTDCGSCVMADELGLFIYGVDTGAK